MKKIFVMAILGVSIIGAPQQVSAAGELDGVWAGELSCFFYLLDDDRFGQMVDDSTEIKSTVELNIEYNKIIKHSGFPASSIKPFTGKINSSEKDIIIQTSHSKMGVLSLEGKFHNVEGDKFIKFDGEAADGRECGFYMQFGSPEIKKVKPAPKATPIQSQPKIVTSVPSSQKKATVITTGNPPNRSIEARLEKLRELEGKGLITKEDAARKRREILEGL
jgi:hypothetical protein